MSRPRVRSGAQSLVGNAGTAASSRSVSIRELCQVLDGATDALDAACDCEPLIVAAVKRFASEGGPQKSNPDEWLGCLNLASTLAGHYSRQKTPGKGAELLEELLESDAALRSGEISDQVRELLAPTILCYTFTSVSAQREGKVREILTRRLDLMQEFLASAGSPDPLLWFAGGVEFATKPGRMRGADAACAELCETAASLLLEYLKSARGARTPQRQVLQKAASGLLAREVHILLGLGEFDVAGAELSRAQAAVDRISPPDLELLASLYQLRLRWGREKFAEDSAWKAAHLEANPVPDSFRADPGCYLTAVFSRAVTLVANDQNVLAAETLEEVEPLLKGISESAPRLAAAMYHYKSGLLNELGERAGALAAADQAVAAARRVKAVSPVILIQTLSGKVSMQIVAEESEVEAQDLLACAGELRELTTNQKEYAFEHFVALWGEAIAADRMELPAPDVLANWDALIAHSDSAFVDEPMSARSSLQLAALVRCLIFLTEAELFDEAEQIARRGQQLVDGLLPSDARKLENEISLLQLCRASAASKTGNEQSLREAKFRIRALLRDALPWSSAHSIAREIEEL